MTEQTVSKREVAGEDLEWHSVVARRDDGLVYKVRGAPTSQRGVNTLPAKKGGDVYVVWGVVHRVRPGPMRLTPVGKGIVVQNMIMRILAEKGFYSDPETWEQLRPDMQNAWKVIGAAWISDRIGEPPDG